jgi:hypothetical protein
MRLFARNNPRSWTLAAWFALIGLVVCCPLAWIGYAIQSDLLFRVGFLAFSFSATVAGAMWVLFVVRLAAGAYGDSQDRPWAERPW